MNTEELKMEYKTIPCEEDDEGNIIAGCVLEIDCYWPRGHENYTLVKRLDQPLKEYYQSTDCSAGFRIEPGTVE